MELKIIRKIDKLGRIVIPQDVRKTLALQTGTIIEITVENNTVVLQKKQG